MNPYGSNNSVLGQNPNFVKAHKYFVKTFGAHNLSLAYVEDYAADLEERYWITSINVSCDLIFRANL